jgi:uncharacterized protein
LFPSRAKTSLSKVAVVVFARAPVEGCAKTRLIPRLGPSGAANFQAALISDTLRKLRSLRRTATPYLFFAGKRSPSFPTNRTCTVMRQRGADLGERLSHAFRLLLRRHPAVVIIGTDSPLLPVRLLRQAIQELRTSEAVLGPSPDGGYYLIGLRRFRSGMLTGVRWGTAYAFRDTLRRLVHYNLCCSILPPVADVDRPRDLLQLQAELRENATARRLAPATWLFLKDIR